MSPKVYVNKKGKFIMVQGKRVYLDSKLTKKEFILMIIPTPSRDSMRLSYQQREVFSRPHIIGMEC